MIINGASRASYLHREPAAAGAGVPLLGEEREQALRTHERDFLQFGSLATPFARDLFRSGIATTLAPFLEDGFLEGNDACGPVQRLEPTADHEDGVQPYVTNLALRDAARLFGFYNNDGSGHTFYACMPGRDDLAFFFIRVESGVDAGGPYEIVVSDPMDWQMFLHQLPPA